MGRSYKAIRREEGKPDVVTVFPHTANPVDAVRWCESEGYKVVGHELIDTANDQKHISTTKVKVQPNAAKASPYAISVDIENSSTAHVDAMKRLAEQTGGTNPRKVWLEGGHKHLMVDFATREAASAFSEQQEQMRGRI